MKFFISRLFLISFALFNPLNGPKNLNYYTNEGKKTYRQANVGSWAKYRLGLGFWRLGIWHAACHRLKGHSGGTGSFVPMNGSSWATHASGRLFSQDGPWWTCGVSSLGHHHHLSSGSLKSHWGLTLKKHPFSCSFSKSALTTEHKSFSSLQT